MYMGYHCCHIEKLPEDILLRILQSLPLIDAVATTLVSRTWRNLWEKSCSQRLNLCFDVENLIGVADKPVPEYKKVQYPDYTYYRKNMKLMNGNYVGLSSQIIDECIEGVEMIMQCRRGEEQDAVQGVKSLEIRFPLRRRHSYHIDNWLSSTITSTTKQLILVFDILSNVPYPFEESELYGFPFEVLLNQKNSSLEYLQLEYISAKLPQNFDGFPSLRTLKLNNNDLTQEEVHQLLINCPLLEFLKIQECQNLVALQVSTPLPHLKVLILQNCDKLKTIELWAENLSTLEYDTALKMDHLMLRGCHNLTKVAVRGLYYIRGDYFRPLSNDFPFVTALYLDSDMKDLSVVLRDNIFAHLKFLAIFVSVQEDEKDLQYLASSLNVVAPMLEELELHVLTTGSECYKTNNQSIYSGCYHHLRRVAFTGFTGEIGQMMLAKYFLMKARRLQIMTIDPLVRYYKNFDAIEPRGFIKRIIDRRCKKAYKLLRKEVPENAKLILVGNY